MFNEKSLANLNGGVYERKPKPKMETKMISLNIGGFEDYLYRMAKYNNMSMTEYIRQIISNDYNAHLEEYEALQKLRLYDKPDRTKAKAETETEG